MTHEGKCKNRCLGRSLTLVCDSLGNEGWSRKTSPDAYGESLFAYMGTLHMHTGIWPKQIAYGDSLFANGRCMHMVINVQIGIEFKCSYAYGDQ
jgi:hypothetical protein